MQHRVVNHDSWLAERKELLAKEKAFTRQRDDLSRQRRELPWERVETDYAFTGAGGRGSQAISARYGPWAPANPRIRP